MFSWISFTFLMKASSFSTKEFSSMPIEASSCTGFINKGNSNPLGIVGFSPSGTTKKSGQGMLWKLKIFLVRCLSLLKNILPEEDPVKGMPVISNKAVMLNSNLSVLRKVSIRLKIRSGFSCLIPLMILEILWLAGKRTTL